MFLPLLLLAREFLLINHHGFNLFEVELNRNRVDELVLFVYHVFDVLLEDAVLVELIAKQLFPFQEILELQVVIDCDLGIIMVNGFAQSKFEEVL